MIKPTRQLLTKNNYNYSQTNSSKNFNGRDNGGYKALQIQFIVFAIVAFKTVVDGVPVAVTEGVIGVNETVPSHNRTTRCYIPNSKENGTCLEASKCPPYIRLKSLSDLTLDTSLEYLTSVHCENETNVDEPLVCCPSDSNVEISKEFVKQKSLLPDRKLKKQKRRISLVTESGIVSGECGKQVTNRIYGGEIAELDEYPWMVLLVYNSSE